MEKFRQTATDKVFSIVEIKTGNIVAVGTGSKVSYISRLGAQNPLNSMLIEGMDISLYEVREFGRL